LEASLSWSGDLRFSASIGAHSLDLDGDGRAAVSPVQALALALLGCMATDVVHILTRSRQPLAGLQARFSGVRAAEDPRRFTSIHLHFHIEGAVPADRVEHALSLSRETYCSVWHSLRPDIELLTSFDVAE
jgi:putative redox protein